MENCRRGEQRFPFIFSHRQFNDAFDPFAPDDTGYAAIDAAEAVFPLQRYRKRQRQLFVVQNGPAQKGSCLSDAEWG